MEKVGKGVPSLSCWLKNSFSNIWTTGNKQQPHVWLYFTLDDISCTTLIGLANYAVIPGIYFMSDQSSQDTSGYKDNIMHYPAVKLLLVFGKTNHALLIIELHILHSSEKAPFTQK